VALKITQVVGPFAMRELERLQKAAVARGHQAFLIGNEASRLEEDLPSPEEVSKALKLIETFNVEEWLKERRAEMDENEMEIEDELVGTWPGEIFNKGELSLHRDHTGKGLKQVAIGEVDMKHSWQIPVAVNYGGWNECPDSVVQGAMFKRWHERYGAEIRGLSFDTIECHVERPPKSQKEALELAWEQFYFCEDIVTQGVGDINSLGATLINSPYWFFWWD